MHQRRISTLLPALPESALAARRFAMQTLRAWDVPTEVSDPAVLLVSELVTNAVRHARGQVELVLERSTGVLRGAVRDGTRARPQARRAEPSDEGGRGLALVAALATRWGVLDDEPGKQVWFELQL
ncbi:MAG: ATP-binding protein [Mycobacteriales bacterium]